MKSLGIHKPVNMNNFFKMAGKVLSDFVNVYNLVYDWYTNFGWYAKPYSGFLSC